MAYLCFEAIAACLTGRVQLSTSVYIWPEN
jgi:hypothetical protein